MKVPCFPITCNWSGQGLDPRFLPPCGRYAPYGDPEEARSEPLLDGDGQEIKEGSVVVDDMFGEVIHCVTRRKPRVLESRMQRVRMERRELHPAVGSVPDGFHCRPRAFDTG